LVVGEDNGPAVDRKAVAVDGDRAGDLRKGVGGQGEVAGDVDGVGFAVAIGRVDGIGQGSCAVGAECRGADRRGRQQKQDQRDKN